MKRLILIVLWSVGVFCNSLYATGNTGEASMDNLFGMDDVIEQGGGNESSFDLEGLAYNGIDPPPDPDAGVPVDGGIVTVIGGALVLGARQLRKKKDSNDVV